MWRLSNMLLNNYWVNEEIKGEIKKYLKTNENETTIYQNLWDVAQEVYSNTGLLQETRKISNHTPKETRKKNK